MSRKPMRRYRQSAPLRSVLRWSIAGSCAASSAHATTTLTVDLSATIRPVTHAASGSLYGVTETLPADLNGLVAPLHPKMFTNPAADVQQPVGDAIVVAGRLAATGATVTIRLADWLKGFYTFTTMSDWLDKVGQTVSRKQAAKLTNVYGYEIWNEPGGTWASSNSVSFNEFWRQTYARLRQLDPGEKIIGPSTAWYDSTFINGFLSFCKTNNCLPDIVSWHELGDGNLAGDFQNYRALEKQLGIGPLAISINEYSGPAHIDVEGQPGASAPLIAKFERFSIDSACISFWDVPHPGRLGSLLATNTEPNGGWWLYKWYGDMTGNMVSTTPPTPTSAKALDGFANLDETTETASVIFGGVNDGTIQVVVKGFKAATFFGNTVRAVVEHTPFVNRTTVVKATDNRSTADVNIANDQIAVSVTAANATDGYRLVLKPAAGGAGSAAGGMSATAGGKASAGSSAAGGTQASGGTQSAAGSVATGGRNSASGGAKGIGGLSDPFGAGGSTGLVATGGHVTSGGHASATDTTLAVMSGGATSAGIGGRAATSDKGTGGAMNGGTVAANSAIGAGG
ncbi:MAG TPA: hypothetical protein VIV60_04725, partial [Polyangiaceae bacterium]